MKGALGILGGTNLSDPALLGETREVDAETPFGPPSDKVFAGAVAGTSFLLLPRHGRDHTIPPHRVNHRANVAALKFRGASKILAVSSVGSLHEAIEPATLLVPDDFLAFWDIPTFYDDRVVHITPAFDEELRRTLVEAAEALGVPVRDGGVYVQTRGPRLETKAEIRLFRAYGDVVGMTMASEGTLAVETGLGFAGLCSVDNYAHGVTDEPPRYEEIRQRARTNAERVAGVVRRVLEALA